MLEHSCGAILFTKEEGKRKYVLIMEANGSYGFPKGHKDENETNEETALREIKEETGIDAQLITGIKRTITYNILNGNQKEVTYYAAKFENQDLCPLDKDILMAKKFDIESALSLLKFKEIRNILVEVDYMLELKGE